MPYTEGTEAKKPMINFNSNDLLINRIVAKYNDTCPYGGYWDIDYIVDYVNDYFADYIYPRLNINSIDMLIDYIVGDLISAS
jgi:hypothetical protein